MIDVEDVLSKMNPNQKINYDRVMQKMVKVWEADQKRPTILIKTRKSIMLMARLLRFKYMLLPIDASSIKPPFPLLWLYGV